MSIKKVIAVALSVIMLFTIMPLSAFAWDNGMTFVKKSDSWNGYEGKYSAYVYNGLNYAGIVLKEVDNNGVITVQKGNNFKITLSCGTWTNEECKDGVLPTNDLTWHYGSYDDHHTIISADGSKNPGNSRWSAYLNRDSSKEVQASVVGEFANGSCKGGSSSYEGYDRASDYFRSNERDGGSHEAYGIFNFTDSSLPQINTPGVYTLYLAPTIALNNWKYNNGNSWNTIYGWGRFDYNKQEWENRTIAVTLRVVDDYSFKDVNGNTIKTISAAGESEALKNCPTNTPSTAPVKYSVGKHMFTSYSWSNYSVKRVFNEIATPTIEDCKYGPWITDLPATCGSTGKRHRVCTICGATESGTISYDYTNHKYGDWIYSGNEQHTRTCKYNVNHYETEPCNIVLGECTVCGKVYVDTSAYKNAVQEYNSILSNRDKYIASSFSNYENAINPVVNKQYVTQEQYDNATKEIISAKAYLKEKVVTLHLMVIDNELNVISEDYKSAEYGNTITLSTKNNIEKWVVSTTDIEGNIVDTRINSNSSNIDIVATKSSNILAYISDIEYPQKEYVKVFFFGKAGTVFEVKYVEKSSSYEINDLCDGVGEISIPFYTFDGWQITSITESEIYITATFKNAISNVEKCLVHFNSSVKSYGYDNFVYLGNDAKGKKYAVSSTGSKSDIVEYIDGVSFFAPHLENAYIIEV